MNRAPRSRGAVDRSQGAREIVDRIQRSDGEDEIVGGALGRPLVFDEDLTPRRLHEQRSRIAHVNLIRNFLQARRPSAIRATDEQRSPEPPAPERNPLDTVFERAFEQEQLRANPRCPIAPFGPQFHIEQECHRGACATLNLKRQAGDDCWPLASLRAPGARLRASAPLRRLRNDRNGCAQLLLGLLAADRIPR